MLVLRISKLSLLLIFGHVEAEIFEALWHKVDISNFQCHKNVNFHNNFSGLMIADDLKSKI